jgi:spermidine synthase
MGVVTLQPGDVLHAQTEHGLVMLRRRDDTVELIVNGIFAMDSEEVSSEIALADAVGPGPKRVLVGGLGLGYTPARLLELGASRVDVVELAGPLLEWAAAGVTDQLARIVADPRVRLHHADIADFVVSETGPWDAICLDVDNGPTFLIHDGNERIYSPAMLALFRSRLAPGGAMLVWAEQPSPGLWRALRELDPGATETILPTFRGERTFNYALYECRA